MVDFRKGFFYPLALLSVMSVGAPAMAQGFVGGADEGAYEGGRAAGPVGAIVGGTVGAVGGLLGIDDRPRFREYVEEQGVPSYAYDGPVRPGIVLPAEGVAYYDVPPEYGVREYYTVVDDEPVLVDPYSRRVVDVIY